MKILILLNNDVGLYKFRKELIEELLKENEVYLSLPNGPYVDFFISLGCVFFDTKISRHGTNPFQDLKLFRFYKKIIRQIKPDIVLSFTIKPNVYGGIACQKNKIPYIPNVTGLGNSIENGGILSKITLKLYKKGLKKAKTVFFQNSTNKKFFIDRKIVDETTSKIIPGSGVSLINNPFEEYPKDDGYIRFVTIGRVLKEKGIDELLTAAKIIKNRHDNISFTIVGPLDGKYGKVLEEAVDKKIINYLGEQEDIHKIIKESNATVHPSYHEGTSNVLLETASCGRPILASNVPGCINTFDDEISGLKFEAKNVDSLVEAIEKFINLPYQNKILMGKNGRIKMEKEFDRNIVLKMYLNEIKQSF